MDKVYKYFLKKYILEQKIYFAFVLVTVIAQSIITMCIPLTYQYMLDVVFPKGEVKKFWIVISIMFGCYMTVVVFNVFFSCKNCRKYFNGYSNGFKQETFHNEIFLL